MTRFSAYFTEYHIEINDEEFKETEDFKHKITYNVQLDDDFYLYSYKSQEDISLIEIGCNRDMTPQEIYERCIAYICLTGF